MTDHPHAVDRLAIAARLPDSITFEGTRLVVIDRERRPWISAGDVGRALGFSDARRGSQSATPSGRIADIHRRHADEFTEDMTALIDLPTAGGVQKVRIFSPRGCYLIAMFARTPKAKAFRRWVLDVLDRIGTYTVEPIPAPPPPPAIAPVPTLADDMLEGAEGIAAFMGLSPRQIYHQQKRLPLFRVGAIICARKSTLLRWIAEQESAALSKPSG
ncbi:MAG TPA: Bro-N domain-containing protein [Azospirillum sp.]